MNEDLTIKLPQDEPATPQRLSFEDAVKQPRPFTYISIETGALTTIGGDPDPTDPRLRPAPPLLRCMGQGLPDESAQMGLPAAPTAVIAPTPRARKALAGLETLTHSEALARPDRPITFRNSTGTVTTLN